MANKTIKLEEKPRQQAKATAPKDGGIKPARSFKLEIASMPWLTPYIPGILLFVGCIILSLFIYKDYGVSWDEPVQRTIGQVSYNYIFNHDNALKTYEFKALGTGFELPLIFIEKAFHLTDYTEVYQARHLATHLFFLIAALCGYVLAYRLFNNKLIACFAFIFLVFQPRMYAHSYFNTKDIPFLSAFLIAMLACHISFCKNKPLWYLLLGVACGYATSIRAIGILFLPSIGLLFAIDIFRAIVQKEKILPAGSGLLLFIAGFFGMMCLCWPFLWSNPLGHFTESFHDLAKIVWNGEVLFNGRYYNGDMLPWTYMPGWFSITMPEVWLASGIAGICCVIFLFVKKPADFITNTPQRQCLLYLAFFFGPALAMTLFHGVNINDWRHLYFIYPSFVFLALLFINKMLQTKYKSVVLGVFALQLGLIGFFMIKNHPFEQVYFNNLVSHAPGYLRNNYEMEYWGCSYKQGFERLLATDASKTIRVNCDNRTLVDNNISFLPEEDRPRMQYAVKDAADYYVADSKGKLYNDFPSTPFDSIEVLNSAIYYIYKQERDPEKQKQIRWARIADLRNTLAIHPDDTDANERIGIAFKDNGVYDSAELYLKHNLALRPQNTTALTNLGLVYNAEKRYAEAIELFKRSLQIDPRLNEGESNIGDAFFAKGDMDSAEYHEQMALKQNPRNEGAVNDLAGIYFYRKQYPQAITMYKKAIETNPQYVRPYVNISVCCIYLTKYDSAIYYSRVALAIDPSFNTANEVLAATYQAAGNADMAKRYETIAQKNNPAFKLN